MAKTLKYIQMFLAFALVLLGIAKIAGVVYLLVQGNSAEMSFTIKQLVYSAAFFVGAFYFYNKSKGVEANEA